MTSSGAYCEGQGARPLQGMHKAVDSPFSGPKSPAAPQTLVAKSKPFSLRNFWMRARKRLIGFQQLLQVLLHLLSRCTQRLEEAFS